jgi:CRISPR-associated protein Cmr2
LIFEPTDGMDLGKFNDIIDKIRKKLADMIAETSSANKEDIEGYLKDYLQLHALELDSNSNTVFADISQYLDSLECQTAYVQQEPHPYLVDFFEYLHSSKYNKFIEHEFGNQLLDEQTTRFPSTGEIATADLAQSNPKAYKDAVDVLRQKEKSIVDDKAQDRIETKRKLKRKKELDTQIAFYEKIALIAKARQRHKYIAVIQADGDNMSKLIAAINVYPANATKSQSERFKTFSKQLMAFSLAATKLIKDFGSTNIYAGGDDLLLFSPLVGTDNKSFLCLLNDIDALFNKFILENEELKPIIATCGPNEKPTMTYGISISYYKFPLGETHLKAWNQLVEKAKKHDNKNALSFEVRKHSGQEFGGLFTKAPIEVGVKPTNRLALLRDLLDAQIDDNQVEKFVSSLTHTLAKHEHMLLSIAAQPEAELKKLLHNFFTNNFDEPIHKTAAAKQYITRVEHLTYALLLEKKNVADDSQDDERKTCEMEKTDPRLLNLYAALRLAQFIRLPFKNDEDRQ